jgi:hypothetical protein
MAVTIGEVGVNFVANLDGIFKSLEKLGEKLDEALSGKQEIKVSFDDRIVTQIEKIADGVEKISSLTERFRTVAEGVFDSLDGRVGNTSEQIERSFGGAVNKIEGQTDDFITSFVNKISRGVSRLSPMVLGQLFGATLLIERLVQGSFKLEAIFPKFITQGAGFAGILGKVLMAVKSLDFPFLLGFFVDVTQSLLSVTTVVALITTGLRALTGLTLRFLGRRPETQVQKFVVLLETLNAGLTEMLATTRIFIERMFFITSGLTATAGILTIITTGVGGLTAVVSPFLAMAFVGISGIRLAAAKVSDWLLRIRASAGDGRAQTTLFLRALRSLFPILDALARNARPIARMITEFAKGGLDKRIKKVVGQFKEALSGISRIEDAIKRLAALLETTSKTMIKQMDQFIDKADALFNKIGRQGARDALAAVEVVRSSATKATKEVQQGISNIAPAAQKAGTSVKGLGARLFEMGRRALSIVGRAGTLGTGSLLSLMLFGATGSIVPFLSPLNLFRDRLLGGFTQVADKAKATGTVVTDAFSSGAAVKAASGFIEGLVNTFSGLLDIGLELSKRFWGVFVDPRTITTAFAFAGQTIAGLAPLLAIGFGAVFTPLILRTVKNLASASFGVLKDAASTIWPVVRRQLVEPVKDFLLFLPRQVKAFATQTIPDMVSRLTARVFKGTVAIGERIKQFFGLTELTEDQAGKKAVEVLQKRTQGIKDQRTQLEQQLVLLRENAAFGDDEIARRAKLKAVEEKLADVRMRSESLAKRLATGTSVLDPAKGRQQLEAQRKEIEKLVAAAHLLKMPFNAVQQSIIETDTQLRSLTNTLSKELSQEAIQKLTQEIQRNSRPIRSTIARIGIDTATAFASGIKAGTSVVKAVLLAPFSAAATRRQLSLAGTNLAKSFRSAFSAAFRVAGGIASVLGLDKIAGFLNRRAGGAGAGLTAGTPEQESTKRKAAADERAAKLQNELTEVLRAEKIVAEAGLKRKKLEQAVSELQISNQKLMSGELEKTENVMREMAVSFEGLTGLARKLEDATRQTAAHMSSLSETLDPADFQASIALAREIEQALPNFKEMRSQFERLADATGMDVKTREANRLQLDSAEEKLRAALQARIDAALKLTGTSEASISIMKAEMAALEKKAASDQGTVQDQEAVTALRVQIAKRVQAAETQLLTELVDLRASLEQQQAATKLLEQEQEQAAAALEKSTTTTQGAAAFIKFSKQISVLAGQVRHNESEFKRLEDATKAAISPLEKVEAQKKAAAAQQRLADASERLQKAEANRAAVIERSTGADKAVLENISKTFKDLQEKTQESAVAEKGMTRRLVEVSDTLLATRTALTRLPNVVKEFTAKFNTITKTEGTQFLSTLAAQSAAGQELVVFTDKATLALKAQAADFELQQRTLDEEEKAAKALVSEKASSKAVQKQLNKALQQSAIREEEIARLTGSASTVLAEVKVAEEGVADAAKVHEGVVQDGTKAQRELSMQTRRVADALEKAKLAIDEGGQSMKELATAADQTKATTKPARQGARMDQGSTGQLRDLIALLLTKTSAAEIEKAPLTPVRERMKNAPELAAINALGESEDELQAVLAILNEISQKPVERIKKLGDGFANLVTLLKRLQANPERMAAFTNQFSPKVIASVSRMVGLMDKMRSMVNKIKVPGGAGARGELKGFEAFALRSLGQLIQQGIEGSIDFSSIADRLLKALREEFKNVKGIEFGDKGKQAIASEMELAIRGAMQQVSGKLSARGEAGVKIAASIAQGLVAGKDQVAKGADTLVKEIAKTLPASLPERGPLRDALMRLPALGALMGHQMLLGVNALREITSQFMRQGFEGMIPAALKAAATLSEKFIGGIGTGLSKIGSAIRKIPIVGMLAQIPFAVAGAVTKALGVVAAGIARMGAEIAGSVTNLVKETSTKLLKLSLDATRLRLDPNDLQRFGEAMGMLGGSASDAEAGLQQLIQSIEQVARGSAPELEAAFADAGLSLAQLRTMKSDEVFLRIANAANEASGDIRRQSDLLRLIGADFSNLRGVVLQGSEKIASAFEKANKNPPIDPKTLELARKFAGIMAQIQQTIERIKIIVFEELAPVLNDALSSFGDNSAAQIDFILENIRTAVRIVINTITLVVNFIRDRYIDANDGVQKLFTDIVVAAKIAFSSLGPILDVVLEHGSKLAMAALEAVWASVAGQTKSALGKVLIDVVAFAAMVANLMLSPFEAAWDFIKMLLERIWAGLKLGFLETINALTSVFQAFIDNSINPVIDLINEISEAFGGEAILERIDLGGSFDEEIKGVHKEMAKLQKEDIPNFFDVVKDKFEETQKDIDKASKSLKDALDIKIATGEVDAFIDGLKGADNEAERLRATIEKLNKDGILTTELTGEETVAELRKALTKAASGGLIPPGAVSEGTERLRREAIVALENVADETGRALKKAFELGFDKVAEEFPEVIELLKQIGVEGQRELDATAVRLVTLRKEQEKLNVKTKENLATQKDISLELIEQRRALDAFRRGFDLRKELQGLTDSFVGPFTAAQREMDELSLQMKEKVLELQEVFKDFSLTLNLDQQLVSTMEMAKGLGITTEQAAGSLNELTLATLELQDAMAMLSSASPETRAGVEARVTAARARLAAAEALAHESITTIQGDLTDGVSKGFEDGMRVAASKPIVNILRTNLIEPVLGAFKATIKGLVDGTLIEAAREAEKVAEITGQKFSRALFVIADFGKKLFETAFDSLLESTFNNLTEGLSASIQDAFKDAEGSATGLGDAAGAAIAAAIQAAIALAGLILSRLQGEISATEEAVESIVESSEAIRGVISGTTTVAIKEAEDAFRDAQRPIVVRLDTIINLMRAAIGGGNIPSIPLSGAGSTAIGP